MSNSSFDSIYKGIGDCAEYLRDKELCIMAKHFAEIFRSAELLKEKEISEDDYGIVANEFKNKWLRKATPWISVSQKMPKNMEPVMVTVRSKKDPNFKDIMKDMLWNEAESEWCWEEKDCYIFMDENMEVTHWMPYPEPAE